MLTGAFPRRPREEFIQGTETPRYRSGVRLVELITTRPIEMIYGYVLLPLAPAGEEEDGEDGDGDENNEDEAAAAEVEVQASIAAPPNNSMILEPLLGVGIVQGGVLVEAETAEVPLGVVGEQEVVDVVKEGVCFS